MATTNTKTQYESLEKKIDQHMNQAAQADERMSRIEVKLDQLAEAVVSIARAEEKISVLIQDTRDIKHSVSDAYNRLHNVEIQATNNANEVKTLTKLFWFVASAAVTLSASIIAIADIFFK